MTFDSVVVASSTTAARAPTILEFADLFAQASKSKGPFVTDLSFEGCKIRPL